MKKHSVVFMVDNPVTGMVKPGYRAGFASLTCARLAWSGLLQKHAWLTAIDPLLIKSGYF